MIIPTTIDDEVREAKYNENFHRSLHELVEIIKPNDNVVIHGPVNPLISKYKDFLDKYLIVKTLDTEEYYKYRHAPKRFSQEIYGTTSYWSMILFLNECHSVVSFDLNKIKYIDPYRLDSIVDEILTLEGLVDE